MRKIEQQIVDAIRNGWNTVLGKATRDFNGWKSGHDAVLAVFSSNRLEELRVTYRGNTIAKIDLTTRTLELFSAGWHTTTTKSRLNTVLTAVGLPGYAVYQHKFDWYLSDGVGNNEAFYEGITRKF